MMYQNKNASCSSEWLDDGSQQLFTESHDLGYDPAPFTDSMDMNSGHGPESCNTKMMDVIK